MKSAPAPLVTFINASNVFQVADLYDIFLANGDNLRWTNADRPVEYPVTGTVILDLNGDPAPGTFVPAVGIGRGGVTWSAEPEVQSLDITLMVTETDLYNAAPFAQRALEGLFDGARFRVYRAFFDPLGALVDVLLHFEGTVAEVEPTSSSIALSVKSELDKLNIKLPQNLYQPGCAHAFLDQGCDPNPPGTLRASVTATGALAGTPTAYVVAISGTATSNFYQLGVILMTSGTLTGQRRGIRSDVDGGGGHQLTLSVPFPEAPLAGDTYSVTRGCARTKVACAAYSNSPRFRGFPYLPRPEDAVRG
jgi:uncharacterized phage protein (TIGR02218 family)